MTTLFPSRKRKKEKGSEKKGQFVGCRLAHRSYANKLFLALQVVWIAVPSVFIGSVQVGFGGVDAAEVKSLANLFDSECRLIPEAGSDGEFGGIVSASEGELFSGPTEALEFFGDDPLCAKNGVLDAELGWRFFCLRFDQVAHLLLENG